MYNILVCDDDKEIVEAIEIYLSQEGYHIFKAYDGMEALEVLKKNDIHLLLIDVMMPKLDGIRATMKIRCRPRPQHSRLRNVHERRRENRYGGRGAGEAYAHGV